MSRKSNKTAHVLNLLTAGAQNEQQAESDEQESKQQKKQMAAKPAKQQPQKHVEQVKAQEPELDVLPAAAEPVPEIAPEPPAVQPVAQPESKEDDTYELCNLAQRAIADKLDEIMKRMNVCECIKCRRDIAALALNMLPSKYVPEAELDGGKYAMYMTEHASEVTAALVKACIKTKQNPHH